MREDREDKKVCPSRSPSLPLFFPPSLPPSHPSLPPMPSALPSLTRPFFPPSPPSRSSSAARSAAAAASTATWAPVLPFEEEGEEEEALPPRLGGSSMWATWTLRYGRKEGGREGGREGGGECDHAVCLLPHHSISKCPPSFPPSLPPSPLSFRSPGKASRTTLRALMSSGLK